MSTKSRKTKTPPCYQYEPFNVRYKKNGRSFCRIPRYAKKQSLDNKMIENAASKIRKSNTKTKTNTNTNTKTLTLKKNSPNKSLQLKSSYESIDKIESLIKTLQSKLEKIDLLSETSSALLKQNSLDIVEIKEQLSDDKQTEYNEILSKIQNLEMHLDNKFDISLTASHKIKNAVLLIGDDLTKKLMDTVQRELAHQYENNNTKIVKAELSDLEFRSLQKDIENLKLDNSASLQKLESTLIERLDSKPTKLLMSNKEIEHITNQLNEFSGKFNEIVAKIDDVSSSNILNTKNQTETLKQMENSIRNLSGRFDLDIDHQSAILDFLQKEFSTLTTHLNHTLDQKTNNLFDNVSKDIEKLSFSQQTMHDLLNVSSTAISSKLQEIESNALNLYNDHNKLSTDQFTQITGILQKYETNSIVKLDNLADSIQESNQSLFNKYVGINSNSEQHHELMSSIGNLTNYMIGIEKAVDLNHLNFKSSSHANAVNTNEIQQSIKLFVDELKTIKSTQTNEANRTEQILQIAKLTSQSLPSQYDNILELMTKNQNSIEANLLSEIKTLALDMRSIKENVVETVNKNINVLRDQLFDITSKCNDSIVQKIDSAQKLQITSKNSTDSIAIEQYKLQVANIESSIKSLFEVANVEQNNKLDGLSKIVDDLTSKITILSNNKDVPNQLKDIEKILNDVLPVNNSILLQQKSQLQQIHNLVYNQPKQIDTAKLYDLNSQISDKLTDKLTSELKETLSKISEKIDMSSNVNKTLISHMTDHLDDKIDKNSTSLQKELDQGQKSIKHQLNDINQRQDITLNRLNDIKHLQNDTVQQMNEKSDVLLSNMKNFDGKFGKLEKSTNQLIDLSTSRLAYFADENRNSQNQIEALKTFVSKLDLSNTTTVGKIMQILDYRAQDVKLLFEQINNLQNNQLNGNELIAKMRSDLSEIDSDNKSSVSDFAKGILEVKNVLRQIYQFQSSNSSSAEVINGLKSQILELESQKRQLENFRIQDQKSGVELTSQIDFLKSQLSKSTIEFKQTQDKLENKVEKINSLLNEKESVIASLNEKLDENAENDANISLQSKSQIDQLNLEINNLINTKNKLVYQLEKANNAASSLQYKLDDQNDSMNKLRNQIDNLKDKNNQPNLSVFDSKSNTGSSKKRKLNNNDSGSQIALLQNKIDDKKLEIRELQSDSSALTILQNQSEQLEEQAIDIIGRLSDNIEQDSASMKDVNKNVLNENVFNDNNDLNKHNVINEDIRNNIDSFNDENDDFKDNFQDFEDVTSENVDSSTSMSEPINDDEIDSRESMNDTSNSINDASDISNPVDYDEIMNEVDNDKAGNVRPKRIVKNKISPYDKYLPAQRVIKSKKTATSKRTPEEQQRITEKARTTRQANKIAAQNSLADDAQRKTSKRLADNQRRSNFLAKWNDTREKLFNASTFIRSEFKKIKKVASAKSFLENQIYVDGVLEKLRELESDLKSTDADDSYVENSITTTALFLQNTQKDLISENVADSKLIGFWQNTISLLVPILNSRQFSQIL